jgi:hypothetical protein
MGCAQGSDGESARLIPRKQNSEYGLKRPEVIAEVPHVQDSEVAKLLAEHRAARDALMKKDE